MIESQDNWNYTRSILFGYAIPFYHLGRARHRPRQPDKLSLRGLPRERLEQRRARSTATRPSRSAATLKPTGSLTWIGNYMVGKEAADLDTRHLFDTTLTLAATSKLSFMGNFDYGKEGDVEWWGIAAYAKLQATPSWAVAARYEYLDDTKGGFMTFGTKAQTITVTSDHTIAGALKARLEYRTDFADEDIFETDDGSFEGLADDAHRRASSTRSAPGCSDPRGGAPVAAAGVPRHRRRARLRPEPAAVLLERLARAVGLVGVEEGGLGEARVQDGDGQHSRPQPRADPLPVAGLHARVLRHGRVVRLEEPRREVRLELDARQAIRPARRQGGHVGRDRVQVVAVLRLEGAPLPQGGDEVEDAAGVALGERVHVERRRHARGHLARVAEHGQAPEDHVVRLAAQVPRAREEAPQVLAPHGATGSRANPQGVFWKSASLHSPGSSSACATRSTGPSSIARQRET